MAMAAVRIAARRLTGQQPQAILRSAVEGEQGLLNRGANARRFTSSEASTANGPKLSTEHPSVSGDSHLRAADQKKEELCDLLHQIQMNKNIPNPRRMKDRWLLHRLTEHVAPRPSNPEWLWYLREQKLSRCLRGTATFLAFLFMVENWTLFFVWKMKVQGADNNSEASASCAEQNIEK
ncbi:unnamed protein product [Alopecurus aequalis]